jgi:nitrogen fixation NifU-like protein
MIDQKILKIASDTSNYGLKKKFTHYASQKNKMCGDRISLEIKTNKNKIEKISYETESCIFCQASASIIADKFKNLNLQTLKKDIILLKELSNNINFKIPTRYKQFKYLIKKKYKNRINCVMLPLNTLSKALKI